MLKSELKLDFPPFKLYDFLIMGRLDNDKENRYILDLKDLVVLFLKNEDVSIVLFGSRARKDSSIFSDVDIGIIPRGKLDESKLSILREEIEDSNIPYKVEIVNFSQVSPDFREEALKDAIIWKE